jgi:hypothetical protein
MDRLGTLGQSTDQFTIAASIFSSTETDTSKSICISSSAKFRPTGTDSAKLFSAGFASVSVVFSNSSESDELCAQAAIFYDPSGEPIVSPGTAPVCTSLDECPSDTVVHNLSTVGFFGGTLLE